MYVYYTYRYSMLCNLYNQYVRTQAIRPGLWCMGLGVSLNYPCYTVNCIGKVVSESHRAKKYLSNYPKYVHQTFQKHAQKCGKLPKYACFLNFKILPIGLPLLAIPQNDALGVPLSSVKLL